MQTYPNPIEDEQYSRELASMYRSDLVLFCSDYERMLAERQFNIKNSGLITFFYSMKSLEHAKKKNFERKRDFVWIGTELRSFPNLKEISITLLIVMQ
jgi:hypothetical protein